MKNFRYSEVSEFCKKHWQDEVSNTFRIADLALENKFLFNLPWDMERTETIVDFGDKIDWRRIENKDNEFLFQLNRHRFLISLGQAYQLSGAEKYAEGFARIMSDWISNVPPVPHGNNPWRSLEVGIRGEHWTQAMRYVEDSTAITEELKSAYAETLKIHADALRKTHNGFHKASNWGTIQDCGLLAIAAELGLESDIELAVTRLLEQTELQIMTDGTHWEQSCTYHNEILLRLLNAVRVLESCGKTVPAKLIAKISKMADVNIAWIKPDFRQPLFGDSDNNELYDLFAQAALVLNRPELKSYASAVLDYESAWLFGANGIKNFDEMPTLPIEIKSAFLENSGSYILRTGEPNSVNYLCMHNGYTGGGHAHADKLHFDLSLAGEDVLVDAGRYTYVMNSARKYFKGASAHNTTTVGNRGFLNMRGWGFWDSALSVPYPVFDEEECALIGGAHLGYRYKLGGMFTERQILLIKPDIYVVIDGFRTNCPHRYRQYFHFHPNGTVKLENNVATFVGEKTTAKIHMITHNAKVKAIPSEFSPHYNFKVKNQAVKVKFRGWNDRFGLTVIYGGSTETFQEYTVKRAEVYAVRGNIKMPRFWAEGIVIKTPKEEYTICIAHKELKTALSCNNQIATGRITVFRGEERIFNDW